MNNPNCIGCAGIVINEMFQSIGFSKNETIIYFELLKSEFSTPLEISKKTKIHRSNTYDALRQLMEKGFVKEIIKDHKKIYQATEPERIIDYMKQKEQEFNLILPELKKFHVVGREQENEISISQGIFAIREIMLDLLKLDSPIHVYGASKEAIQSVGLGFLREYHIERIKKKIQMDHIYNKSAMDRILILNKMKYTEARYLPEKYDTITTTFICADYVLIVIFSAPLTIIKIKNHSIATTYNNYFDLLWKSSIRP